MLKKILKVALVFSVGFFMLVSDFSSGIPAQAATDASRVRISQTSDLSWHGHTTAKFHDKNGNLFYCYDENSPGPGTSGITYDFMNHYYDQATMSLLYYGYGGAGYWSDRHRSDTNTDYVKTWLALNWWKQQKTNAYDYNDPFIQELIGHAKAKDAPAPSIYFDKKAASSSIMSVTFKDGHKDTVQRSDTITVKGDHLSGSENNYAVLPVPNGVTIRKFDKENGQVVNTQDVTGTGGTTVKVWGGQWFYFTAPLSYNSDYKTGNVNAYKTTIQSAYYRSEVSGYQSMLEHAYKTYDPVHPAGFTVNFWARQKNATFKLIDEHSHAVLKTRTYATTIGEPIDYSKYESSFWGGKSGKGTGGDNGNPQTFYKYHWYNGHGDPDKEKMPSHDVTYDFYYTPEQYVDVYHADQYDLKHILAHDSYGLLPVGTWYDHWSRDSITSDGKIYDKTTTAHWQGNVPYYDISKTFAYKLRRSITVHYIDDRTGQKIIPDNVNSKVHQGDHYAETHPNLTRQYGGQSESYTYVGKTGDSESGNVGTNNIDITYHYKAPLARVSLKSMQIYTRPASQGIPVNVQLDHIGFYSNSQKNGSGKPIMSASPIKVGLYQNGHEIVSQSYTADNFPSTLSFTVPSSKLSVNSNAPYTVKLEGYNGNDFTISPSASGTNNGAQLVARGYTAEQKTYTLDLTGKPHSPNASGTQYSGQEIKPVVRTSVSRGDASYSSQYERINYKSTLIPQMKTGYGFPASSSFSYQNDLGQNYQTNGQSVARPTLTFSTSSILNDSNLEKFNATNDPYSVSGNTVSVKMDNNSHTDQMVSKKTITDAFQMPHINVESMTGNLFTDSEMSDRSKSYENQSPSKSAPDVVDGYNKFYIPIWPTDKGTRLAIPSSGGLNYAAQYKTNPMGINRDTVVIKDNINIYAYMYLTVDSNTKTSDALSVQPVTTKPTDHVDNLSTAQLNSLTNYSFDGSAPQGWTADDTKWLDKKAN